MESKFKLQTQNIQIEKAGEENDYAHCWCKISSNEFAVGTYYSGDILFYSYPSLILLHTLSGHEEYVNIIKLISSGKEMLSISYDTTIRRWCWQNYTCLQVFEEHSEEIMDIIELPVFNLLVSASRDHSIIFWKLNSKNEYIPDRIWEEVHENEYVNTWENYKDDKVITGGNDGYIKIWDKETKNNKECLTSLKVGSKSEVFKIFMIDDEKLIVSMENKEVYVCDLKGDDLQKSVHVIEGYKGWLYCMIKLENEDLVFGSGNKTIEIFDKEMKWKDVIKGHTQLVASVIEIQQNKWLSASWDESLKEWWKE